MKCKCGCGQITKIAKRNLNDRGIKKGEHICFIHGHNRRGMYHSKGSLKLMSEVQKKVPRLNNNYAKGHVVSPEARQKISKANKGNPGYWKGRHRTEETKRKISKARMGTHLKEKRVNPGSCGDKHHGWKGGVTTHIFKLRKTDRYKAWRDYVYRKYNWTCQLCLRKLKKLVAHHVLSFTDYPEHRFDVDNGLCVCRSCHKKIHKEIGVSTRFGT